MQHTMDQMKANRGEQYEHRRRSAHLSRPPGHRASNRAIPEVQKSHSVVKLKDLQTGEETVVAFKSGSI